MGKSILPLNVCPMCGNAEQTEYLEDGRYKYWCNACGQYFEFNAPSQLAADTIYNHRIARREGNKPVTNYEKIIHMSAEELAGSGVMACPYEGSDSRSLMCDSNLDSCRECILIWLKQDAE